MKLSDYSVPTTASIPGGCSAPATDDGPIFDCKTQYLNYLEKDTFCGGSTEDPLEHVQYFTDYCSTINQRGIEQSYVRMILFPFSLRGAARKWHSDLNRTAKGIDDWDKLALAFFEKYFPPEKTSKLRSQIQSFDQMDNESLSEAWDRFNELIRSCPHHGIPQWMLALIFYNNLCEESRIILDSAANGRFTEVDDSLAWGLIDNMAEHNRQYAKPKGNSQKAKFNGSDSSSDTEIMSILAALNAKIDNMTASSQPHQMYAISNQNAYPIYTPHTYQNTHPVYSPPNPELNRLEALLTQSVEAQAQQAQQLLQAQQAQQAQTNLILKMAEAQLAQNEHITQIKAHAKILETQIAQMTNMTGGASYRRPVTSYDEDEINCKDLDENTEFLKDDTAETSKEQGDENTDARPSTHLLDRADENNSQNTEKEVQKKRISWQDQEVFMPIPFPGRLRNPARVENNVAKYSEFENNTKVNTSFTEPTVQTPHVVPGKSPPKLNDPGIYAITCTIGTQVIDKAMCDLGSSVSAMPYSVYEKLNIGPLKCTNTTLQMADRSLKYPRGILEDVPVKIGKFLIPVDFMVLDMPEDTLIPIILGRPFLHTAGAVIDTKNGSLTLEVDGEKITFNLHAALKQPMLGNTCCLVTSLDVIANDVSPDLLRKDEIFDPGPDEMLVPRTRSRKLLGSRNEFDDNDLYLNMHTSRVKRSRNSRIVGELESNSRMRVVKRNLKEKPPDEGK